MGKLNVESLYKNTRIILTTKHQKSSAIGPVFSEMLGATIIEKNLDTDSLGTFSGEISRKGSAYDCVKEKCLWGLEHESFEYGLASEGSFGPHPYIPGLPCGKELLYFFDKKRNFELCVETLSFKTNYQMSEILNEKELFKFAEKALFPSHALIIRPFPRDNNSEIFKGIQNMQQLTDAFTFAKKQSPVAKVWVETDMRAHLNPTRMESIQLLAVQLAKRLLCLCQACSTPGFGKVGSEKGLPCKLCGLPTEQVKAEIMGCVKCDYVEYVPCMFEGEAGAYCQYCNP